MTNQIELRQKRRKNSMHVTVTNKVLTATSLHLVQHGHSGKGHQEEEEGGARQGTPVQECVPPVQLDGALAAQYEGEASLL